MITDQRLRDKLTADTRRFAVANTAAQVLFLAAVAPVMILDPERLVLWAILWVALSGSVMWWTTNHPGKLKKIEDRLRGRN